MKTGHHLFNQDAREMRVLEDQSIDLVVTSPPYPIIEMWDPIFSDLDPAARSALKRQDGAAAFEAMHQVLDRVWEEVSRVLKSGGFACINIGDAVRTFNGNFSLFTNHSRIIQTMQKIGFTSLPCILWRKQTNAPNKFMGSGMLPAGAYVTLEHEYILIFRKGGKREFKTLEEKAARRSSALFWEERNIWFSDVWTDIKGTTQRLDHAGTRNRSGAFPFELAFRLINMYSAKADTVLDPFMGLGTTAAAAMCTARNSIGFEIDTPLCKAWEALPDTIMDFSKQIIAGRLADHIDFVTQRLSAGKEIKHRNAIYGFPVVTAQEKELWMPEPLQAEITGPGKIEMAFEDQPESCPDFPDIRTTGPADTAPQKERH